MKAVIQKKISNSYSNFFYKLIKKTSGILGKNIINHNNIYRIIFAKKGEKRVFSNQAYRIKPDGIDHLRGSYVGITSACFLYQRST